MPKTKTVKEVIHFSKPRYGAHEVEEMLKDFSNRVYAHGLEKNLLFLQFKYTEDERKKQDYIN